MIINQKMLSIPPYLSTSWTQVASLNLNDDGSLLVNLKNGIPVFIPDLNQSVLEAIFSLHARFLDQNESQSLPKEFPLALGGGLMDISSALIEHDSAKADSPNLPEEILIRVKLLGQQLGPLDPEKLPKAEPHCNCPHCQITRAIFNKEEEELVSDKDLQFKEWDVKELGNKSLCVSNPLSPNEFYTVSLGAPISCTCGQEGCAHIKAALKS